MFKLKHKPGGQANDNVVRRTCSVLSASGLGVAAGAGSFTIKSLVPLAKISEGRVVAAFLLSNDAAAGFVCWIIIFVVLFVIAVAWSASRLQDLHTTYSRVARSFEGTAAPGGWLSTPSLRFQHRGAPVLLDIASGGSDDPDYTQLHIAWPDSTFRCTVYPERFFSQVGKFLGMQDIEIGDPDFDRAYIITGNDLKKVRDFLNARVREKIDQLRDLRKNDDIYVAVTGSSLLIKKRDRIDGYDELKWYTQTALDLFDYALDSHSSGIEFIPSHEEAVVEAVICQICGDAITSDAVVCSRCRTPHHRDCWQYYGACSTYGCRETKYALPKKDHAPR